MGDDPDVILVNCPPVGVDGLLDELRVVAVFLHDLNRSLLVFQKFRLDIDVLFFLGNDFLFENFILSFIFYSGHFIRCSQVKYSFPD